MAQGKRTTTQPPARKKAKGTRSPKSSSVSPAKRPTRPTAVSRSDHNEPSLTIALRDFVKQAWIVLEPVTELQWNWHLDLICEYLTLIQQNKLKDALGTLCEGVIFNVLPRTMKSLLITVFFPAWVWTSDPARRFMFASYSEKLSTQHSVYRRCVMESDWYQKNWGHMFSFARIPASISSGTGIADWPLVYGHIATATGWTYHQIDQLTLWEANELFAYWQDYPPTHTLVAAYLMGGSTGRTSKRRPGNHNSYNADNFDDLSRIVATAGGCVNSKLPDVYR